VDIFVIVLLQIQSGICMPKIIKIEHDLTKVIEKIKQCCFLPHSVYINRPDALPVTQPTVPK